MGKEEDLILQKDELYFDNGLYKELGIKTWYPSLEVFREMRAASKLMQEESLSKILWNKLKD